MKNKNYVEMKDKNQKRARNEVQKLKMKNKNYLETKDKN